MMFNIIHHHQNANQTHKEIPLYTPTRITIIIKIDNNKCRQWCGNMGILFGGCRCKMKQPIWKNVWNFLKKLNITLLFNLVFFLLVIYPEKTYVHSKTCMQMFILALLIGTKNEHNPNVYPNEDKQYVICLHNRILFTNNIQEILIHAQPEWASKILY